MTAPFDPYLQWLGIRDPERPPNHYRLLGIDLLESDADVIETAADRQMAHLRTFQNGPRGAESQRLLNEVAAARICLLDPQQRAAYESRVRASGSQVTSDLVDVAIGGPPPLIPLQRPGRGPRAEKPWTYWLAVASPVLLLIVGLMGYRMYRDHRAAQISARQLQQAGQATKPSKVPPSAPSSDRNPVPPTGTDSSGSSGDATVSQPPVPTPPTPTAQEQPSADAAAATATPPTDGSGTPATTQAANSSPSPTVAQVRQAPVPQSWDELLPPTPDHAPKFSARDPLGAFLIAISQRDLAAAGSTLKALRQNPAVGGASTQLQDAEVVYEASKQFWHAVTTVHQALTVGFQFEYRGMPVTVSKHGTTYVELTAPNGVKKVFSVRRAEIDRDLAMKLTELQFAAAEPAGWRLIAAFLLVDHQGDTVLAKQYVAQAEERGFAAEFLPLLLSQLSGQTTDTIPAVADILTETPPPATSQAPDQPLTTEANSNARVPSDDAQREARRTVLTPALAAIKESVPAERWAAELLKRSTSTELDDVARYVLLKNALQRATAARDLDTALSAIDSLATQYEMDGDDLRIKMLQALVRRIKADARRSYAELAIDWTRGAICKGQFATAVRLADLAQTVGKPVTDPFFRRHLQHLVEETKQLQTQAERLADLRAQAADSSNVEAQQQLARFVVLSQGDFETGLDHLQQSTDLALQTLAEQELARPTSSDQQFEMGRAWFEFGQSLADLEQGNAYRRAQLWLLTSRPGLDREHAIAAREMLDGIERVLGRDTSVLDLTTQIPLSAAVGLGTFGVNKNVDFDKSKLPQVDGQPVTRFLWTCAPSRVEYLIPAGAKTFSATLVVNAATQDGARFVVRADQTVLYASPPLKTLGAQLPIRVQLPEGARILELLVDQIANNAYDHCYWVTPELAF